MVTSKELVWLSEATKAIAKVATVVDAKVISDKAAALRKFADAQGWSVIQRAEISEIEIRAVARMGELLKAMPKAKGTRGQLAGGSRRAPPADSPTLAESGVTKKQSSRAQQVASVPAKEREKYIAENKPKDKLSVTGLVRIAKERSREARREVNREKISSVSDPTKSGAVYSTIVIDPPWDWGDEGDKDQLGRAKPDYATMSIEQLEQLPIGKLADTDCHLYLWITNRSLPKGFRLLEAWDFRYITAITWVKPHFGMGNYFRGQTEHVLFGVKGSQLLKRKDAGTVFNADRGKAGHSSKPESFLPFVESCSPGPYLELFSRSERVGWSMWGENANG